MTLRVGSAAGGCWPTPEQELLLQAALLPGSRGVDAWREWSARVDLDALDFGSHRLLPLLHRNLLGRVDDPRMPKYKGVYRYNLVKNRLLVHAAHPVLQAFHAAGIETLLLKGVALVLRYYQDPGLRPMDDFDVLVPAAHATAAMGILRDHGWTPLLDKPEQWIPIRHSTPFRDVTGRQIDLHWHVMWECWRGNADDEFWRAARAGDIEGLPTRTLDPTDQLFHVCVHGAEWNEIPPIRWVADATTVIRAAKGGIDWSRLVAHARHRRVTGPLQDCLAYLREALDEPVPIEVVRELRRTPRSWCERVRYRDRRRGPAAPTTREIVSSLWTDGSWLLSSTPARHAPLALARFVQNRWKVPSLRRLPLFLVGRAARRLLVRPFALRRAKQEMPPPGREVARSRPAPALPSIPPGPIAPQNGARGGSAAGAETSHARLTLIAPARFAWSRVAADLRALWDARDLLLTLSRHRFRVRYRQSVLGVVWAVLQPLALMLTYTVIFSHVARVDTGALPYPVFVYVALLPWTYLSTVLTSASNALVSHANLVTKISFPREVLPLSYVAAALVDIVLAFGLFLGLMAYWRIQVPVTALYVGPLLVLLAAFAAALALLLSAVQARMRDVSMALPLVLQVWLFASPVVYALDAVPASLRSVYILNPLVGIVDGFRRALLLGLPPDPMAMAVSTAVTVVLLPLAYGYFRWEVATIADRI